MNQANCYCPQCGGTIQNGRCIRCRKEVSKCPMCKEKLVGTTCPNGHSMRRSFGTSCYTCCPKCNQYTLAENYCINCGSKLSSKLRSNTLNTEDGTKKSSNLEG